MTCFVWVNSVLEQGIAIWIHSSASEVPIYVPEKQEFFGRSKKTMAKAICYTLTTQVHETQTGNPA